jgi:hypothetical protein
MTDDVKDVQLSGKQRIELLRALGTTTISVDRFEALVTYVVRTFRSAHRSGAIRALDLHRTAVANGGDPYRYAMENLGDGL